MTVFDHVFLAVLLLSVLLGLWRGLVSEVFILGGWMVALFVAWKLAPHCAPLLAGVVGTDWARWPVAFITIFVLVLIILAGVRFLLRGLLSISGLSLFDRLAGAGFGMLRGLVLALLFVAGAGLTELPKRQWWQEAVFAPPLVTAVIAAKPWLPGELAKRLKY